MSSPAAIAVIDRLLETEEQAPGPEQVPQRQVPHASRAKWAGARGTFRDLYRLKVQSMDILRQMGFSIEYSHALAELGYTRDEVEGPVNAEHVGSTDNLPQNHPARRFFRTFAKQFPKAVVGAKLPDGSVLFFNDPVSRNPDVTVPTYAEYAQRLSAASAERAGGYG